MAFLDYHTYHLVGIKGVALTALAQCLLDAHKVVTGSDVSENFVTHQILDHHLLSIQVGFDQALPPGTECLIYTAAHGGNTNPQVILAQDQGVPVFSHAQALAELFNQLQGIAVCGVGGKSTTSAMITWILDKLHRTPSFAVGVGNIPGLNKTGHWSLSSTYFVAEADEYAEQPKPLDPQAQTQWHLVPRFHYLQPWLTLCTNLRYDHPDVYRDFAQTKDVFKTFFSQIKPGGHLVCSSEDLNTIVELAPQTVPVTSFGASQTADFQLTGYHAAPGQTQATFVHQENEYHLTLQIPGKFNILNALGAIAATTLTSVSVADAVAAVADFPSTMRRFELVGQKNGVTYYDDYAHHPHEVTQAIEALNEWYPQHHKLIMFQSHTFSRTKELFAEFVDAFQKADEVVMIDIFPSARENPDSSISSDILCQSIKDKYPQLQIQNVKTIAALAQYCRTHLHPGDVALTLGAGDIYHVHDQL